MAFEVLTDVSIKTADFWVHYPVQNNPTLDTIMSQMKPVQTLTACPEEFCPTRLPRNAVHIIYGEENNLCKV
jgi:uncharacterized protein YbbK (DUF523 family)